MAGTAATRELIAVPGAASCAGRPAREVVCRLAEPADAAELRRLLRDNPLDGAIRLSFECEPDALAAGRIYGPVHQTLVAHDCRTRRIVAMACRAERDVYVNGRVQRVGYLGQLRVEPSARRRPRLLASGFEHCRALHRTGGVPAYLVSIVEGNRPARRLLAAGHVPGFPTLTPIGPFLTVAMSTRQGLLGRRPRRGRLRIERGRPELAGPMAECLRRWGARHQLAPVWTADDLVSGACTPCLRIEDFLVTLEAGRVSACVALWDQRSFRQTVVRGYSPLLARLRPMINATGWLTGAPPLPAIGTAIPFAFLSHLAIDRDDGDRAMALVDAALAEARAAGVPCLVLGLSARHPLAPVIATRVRHRRYLSQLFLAHWDDGDAFARSLDARPAQPEVAVL